MGAGTLACSKPAPAPPPAAEEAVGAEQAEVSIDGVAWSDMDTAQREKYMADVVMPSMQELFVEFDPEAFGKSFGCATCHGNNATEVGFKMPNGLRPLDPNSFPTPASSEPEVAKWATFMFTKVTPKMVELLGAEPYDMETETGFGCYGCHAEKP